MSGGDGTWASNRASGQLVQNAGASAPFDCRKCPEVSGTLPLNRRFDGLSEVAGSGAR
jgi:hypothetical protein